MRREKNDGAIGIVDIGADTTTLSAVAWEGKLEELITKHSVNISIVCVNTVDFVKKIGCFGMFEPFLELSRNGIGPELIMVADLLSLNWIETRIRSSVRANERSRITP